MEPVSFTQWITETYTKEEMAAVSLYDAMLAYGDFVKASEEERESAASVAATIGTCGQCRKFDEHPGTDGMGCCPEINERSRIHKNARGCDEFEAA